MKNYIIFIMFALVAVFSFFIEPSFMFVARMVVESTVLYFLFKLSLANIEVKTPDRNNNLLSNIIPIVYVSILTILTLIVLTSYMFDRKVFDVAKILVFSVKKMYLIESSISIYFKQAFGGFLSLLLLLDLLKNKFISNEYLKIFAFALISLFLISFGSYITKPVILQSAILALLLFSVIKILTTIVLGKLKLTDYITEITLRSFAAILPFLFIFASYSYIFPLVLFPVVFAMVDKLYNTRENEKYNFDFSLNLIYVYLFLTSSFYLITGNKLILNNIYIAPFLLICFALYQNNKEKILGVFNGN